MQYFIVAAIILISCNKQEQPIPTQQELEKTIEKTDASAPEPKDEPKINEEIKDTPKNENQKNENNNNVKSSENVTSTQASTKDSDSLIAKVTNSITSTFSAVTETSNTTTSNETSETSTVTSNETSTTSNETSETSTVTSNETSTTSNETNGETNSSSSTVVDTTAPTNITNIKTATSIVGQDTRITNIATNYVSWSGGDDSDSDILKYIVYQYTTNNCSGSSETIETTQKQTSFNASLDQIYTFKIKAINNVNLETMSECSGSITRISDQTNISNATISINGGDSYTKDTTVTLTLAGNNATELYVTNTDGCASDGTWQNFTINKSWNLSQTNTTATVYVKFRDIYNRESPCINDTIIHDSNAPTNTSLSITNLMQSSDEQGTYSGTTHVTLNLTATGASHMYISNTSCSANGSWETYAVSKAWTLSQTNAINTVYAKFKDLAGNESNCNQASLRHFDNAAPASPSIYINYDPSVSLILTSASFTSTQSVELYLYASDNELTEVAISNGTECVGSWEPFIANYQPDSSSNLYKKSWLLSGTHETTYVSAKFKDVSGNISGCTTRSIKLVAMDNVADVYTGNSGTAHVCLKSSTGRVKCWGRNDYGQLGYGYAESLSNASSIGKTSATIGLNSTYIDVGTNRTVTQMALGVLHSCALLDDGNVKCWGGNAFGQLGLGHTNNVISMGDSLQSVNLGGTVTEISAGWYHTCARMTTGTVKCWGVNTWAQLGIGSTTSVGDTPNPIFTAVDLGTNKTAIQISAGAQFTCALLNDNTAKCWGQNANKQCGQDIANFTGDGTNLIGNQPNQLGDNLPAILVGVGKTITQIATGSGHACALLNDGGVKCWGSSAGGVLGYYATYNTGNNRPYVNFGSSSFLVTKISANLGSTCAVTSNGTKCWGTNDNGQLGQGDMVTRGVTNNMYNDSVLPFINFGTNKTVSKISSGFNHSCVVFTDHTAKCWGSNGYGQLGIGSTNNMGDNLNEMGNYLPEL